VDVHAVRSVKGGGESTLGKQPPGRAGDLQVCIRSADHRWLVAALKCLLEEPLKPLTNIRMKLGNVPEELATKAFYGKVIESKVKATQRYLIRFTSISPEIAAYFQALRQYATK